MKTGICRPIETLLKRYCPIFKTLLQEDSILQLYAKRYIINSHSPSKDMIAMLKTQDIIAFRACQENMIMTSSRIPDDIERFVSDSLSNNDIIDILLSKMEILQESSEAVSVFRNVVQMIRGVADQIVLYKPNKINWCIPILVGSKNEDTQCFYPNEFDFLLCCDKLGVLPNIGKVIRNATRAYNRDLEESSRLLLDCFSVQLDKRFPCLYCTWIGDEYLDMPITIDIVPVTLNDIVIQSHVLRFKNNFYLDQIGDISHLIYLEHGREYVVSLIENKIIASIMSEIRSCKSDSSHLSFAPRFVCYWCDG